VQPQPTYAEKATRATPPASLLPSSNVVTLQPVVVQPASPLPTIRVGTAHPRCLLAGRVLAYKAVRESLGRPRPALQKMPDDPLMVRPANPFRVGSAPPHQRILIVGQALACQGSSLESRQAKACPTKHLPETPRSVCYPRENYCSFLFADNFNFFDILTFECTVPLWDMVHVPTGERGWADGSTRPVRPVNVPLREQHRNAGSVSRLEPQVTTFPDQRFCFQRRLDPLTNNRFPHLEAIFRSTALNA